jgi:hypothetical protein
LSIIRAILLARTEYIVYFLLSSWLEAVEHDGRARAIPTEAKRLPLRGAGDVRQRMSLVREHLDRDTASTPLALRELESAAAALSVACEQLRELARPQKTPPAVTPIRSDAA